MIPSSEDMIGCGGNDITLNLISNASMETFPGNKLSSFTTLLPTPMTLSGDWQVALLEISWPALVCNVTEGKITVSKSVSSPKLPVHPSNQNFPSGRPGIVSMSTPEVRYIKAGCYSSIDDIMDAILKSATGKSKEKILSPNIQQNKDAPSQSTNISWKVDEATQERSLKYYGNVEKHGLVIQAISQDLKNILGMTTIIDCQNTEQRQKSKNTVDGKFHDDQRNISELTVVKKTLDIGQWTSMLEVTQCFYTATWFRMRHWATHKLRCCDPFPSTAFLQRTNTEEERWTTGAFQICSGKEFTNHNSNQSLNWPTKWVRGCLSWVVVEQALLWHLGLDDIEQKCVGGVTSNEYGTLPLQKLDPSCSSFRKQVRN